jgi:hypothetical protein
VRAVAKNAPAEPTTARIAVGFSGELAQPVCACSGRATEIRRARPTNLSADIFTKILPWEVDGTKVDLQIQDAVSRRPVTEFFVSDKVTKVSMRLSIAKRS